MKRLALAGLLAVAVLIAPAPASAGQITATQATKIANRDPKAIEERRKNPGATASPTMSGGNWEVGYFAGSREVALVVVDPVTGAVRESWTGYQVAWKMARGYHGAFGHKLDAPYVFVPLCAIFLLGLVDWRRLWRVANLDLVILIGFGASFLFFNRGEIGVSVPLQYPPLAYLLGRALWIGFRGRGEGIRPVWPAAWLLVAALFLIGFRVGLNVADSGVIDVGYAGVVGADRIAHGQPIYDDFPQNISQGDTYGPVNYLAYVPFERIWPWSGTWNDLPSAHAASVVFDLLTFGFLILLGIRIRPGPEGRKLAATLAFGWAAFPYTAYALESNSNDTLVAVLLVATLLVLTRPMARGAMTAFATFTKFAPIVCSHPCSRRTHPRADTTTTLQDAHFSPVRTGIRRRLGAGDVMAGNRSRPAHLLRPHHRLPGGQKLPLQRLGPSPIPGTPAHRTPRSYGSSVPPLGFHPTARSRSSKSQHSALGC